MGRLLRHGEASLEFRTLRTLAADEEACLFYGRLPCLQTLQYYGVLDAALLAHEVVQLDLDYPDEEAQAGWRGFAFLQDPLRL